MKKSKGRRQHRDRPALESSDSSESIGTSDGPSHHGKRKQHQSSHFKYLNVGEELGKKFHLGKKPRN